MNLGAIGRFGGRVSRKAVLIAIMALIGSFTAYASLNTYEVIAKRDVPYTNVIATVPFTHDVQTNDRLAIKRGTSHQAGSFGIPKQLKLPEADKHIGVLPSLYDAGYWRAEKGQAHTFLTEAPRQKVFGQAIIYMRVNTPTTRHLGEVYHGDIVNIVTTEGWQLGYQVTETSQDVAGLYDGPQEAASSELIVIMIDETTRQTRAFKAVLSRVGERV